MSTFNNPLQVLLLFLFSGIGNCCTAQLYTTRQYDVRIERNLVAGVDTNYCGRPDTLMVDIYKPLESQDTKRPVVIFAHGGAFTSTINAGDDSISLFAAEFARRGYVAVSMDYREGYHLPAFNPGLPAPFDMAAETLQNYRDYNGGVYAADEAEFTRAAYRAQQDMKAVIRWMKSRSFTDSSSNCKYFIGGFSAGAILSVAAAFTDAEGKKPPAAGAMSALPDPHWLSLAGQQPGPAGKDDDDYRSHNPGSFNYDNPACYLRPDLGSVNGRLNISSGYNEGILGVMCLSGAIADTTIFNNSIYHPALYIYHVPGDKLVPFNSGRPLQSFDSTFFPAPSAFAPVVYGGNWIWEKLTRDNYGGAMQHFFYSGVLPPTLSAHNIFPHVLAVSDSVARFFSHVMEINSPCSPEYTAEYRFTGDGNWNDPANWQNGLMPGSVVAEGVHIIINPRSNGTCRVNIPVSVNSSAGITIVPGAAFDINGNLVLH